MNKADNDTRDAAGLMTSRRFWPLFWTQFLGAMNDNFFKNAMVLLILYRLAEEAGPTLVTAAAGIFILPFFLFSALAGQFADRFERSGLTRLIKLAEIAIMVLGAISLFAGNVTALMIILFLMGTQSTMFGPIKYGILPDLIKRDELMSGNALIEAGTFMAILIGTIAGGLLILTDNGIAIVSAGVLVMAVLGWLTSRFIPTVPVAAPDLVINRNIMAETKRLLVDLKADRALWLSALGVSWFWFVGAVFLAQVPNLTKEVIGGNEQVVTLFLTAFSIGIGVGSFIAARLTHGKITVAPVPLAAIAMAVFSIDLYFATNTMAGAVADPGNDALIGPLAFLSTFAGLRVIFDLIAVSIAGGIYVVPLFTAIQAWSEPSKRARVIASVNILNALFMTGSAIITLILFQLGASVPAILGLLGLANILAAVIVARLLPQELMRTSLLMLFKILFRLEIKGLENVAKAGSRQVIVVNHSSFLDAALMLAVLTNKPVFAVNTEIAKRWWVKPFLGLGEAFPVDPTNPMATKDLIRLVQSGRPLVIFPEGRLTVTGALMKIYDGPAMIADKADAELIPVRLEGAERTLATRLERHQVRRQLFPKIKITFRPPQKLDVAEDLVGKRRREAAGNALYDLMSELMFVTSRHEGTLFDAVWNTAETQGFGRVMLEDVEGTGMSYRRIFAGANLIGSRLDQHLSSDKPVGVMLPNSKAVALTFLALQMQGRIPAMLNFTSGAAALNSAIKTAEVDTIITSRRFEEAASLNKLFLGLNARILYLEDVMLGVGQLDRLKALAGYKSARATHDAIARNPDDTAVILFTSGSEGAPKGVALSHRNILSNCAQVASRADLSINDRFFNVLPNFHSFGLTGGLIMPLTLGIPVFLYPSPLHYRFVPEAVYGSNSTVLFGTDTFLQGYGRTAHAYDFRSLRYVIAGAEPVKPETRAMWMEKFGHRILEGYGVTECSPSLALNTAMHNRTGTVGRLLPMIEHRLETIDGIEEGGRLHVRGPNIMKGYMFADKPGEVAAPDGGWHDTGDIVKLDDDGFISILGRAKRFAKIGGEMVSLTAVEAMVRDCWPDHDHAVVAVPHPRKGEELVLVTTMLDPDRMQLQSHLKQSGRSELMLPARLRTINELPLLGTGKRDYPAISRIARDEEMIEA